MSTSSPHIKHFLREKGIRPKKSLGQNFLTDPNFLDAILRDADVGSSDGVVEIGTGLGHLTERLAREAGHVWTFEVDADLHALSLETFSARKNVTCFLADGEEFSRRLPNQRPSRLKLVSNLPYSVYHRLLVAMLASPLPIEGYTLLLQRDVYDRMRAKPGTKEYGHLAVLVQSTCRIRFLRRAAKRLFYPAPRVESALFRLERKEGVEFARIPSIADALRQLFSQRRKKFHNGRRPEEIPPAELAHLALLTE